MTPEAQRIAIAKACGWQDFYTEANEFRGTPPGTWAYSNRTVYQDGSAPVPDYLNDLNAMHEAIVSVCKTNELREEIGRAHV